MRDENLHSEFVYLEVSKADIPKLYDADGATDFLVVGMTLIVNSVNRQTGKILLKIES